MDIYNLRGKNIKSINKDTDRKQWAVYIEFEESRRNVIVNNWLTFYFESEENSLEYVVLDIKNFLKFMFPNITFTELRVSETFVSSPLKLMDGYELEQTYDDFYCRYKLFNPSGELIHNGMTSRSGRSEEQGCIDDCWKHHDTLIEPYRADWDYIEKLTA